MAIFRAWKKKTIIYLLALFFAAETVAGPLRYCFSRVGHPEANYLFKGLLLMGLLLYVINRILSTQRVNIPLILLGAILLLWGLYGYVNTVNIYQVAFGFWSLVPLIAGVVLGNEVIERWPHWKTFIFLLWGIQVAGVILNAFTHYPWEGTVFSIGGMELRNAKLWYGLGVRRLAGFGRSSAVVSDELVIFAVLLLGMLGKQRTTFVGIWSVSLLAVLLTTSKTGIVVLLAIGLLWVLWETSPRLGKLLLTVLILVIGLILIIIPIIAFVSYQVTQPFESTSLLHSVLIRFTSTWPTVFEFVIEQGNPLLGIGVGGIGTAQKLYNPSFPSITDNLVVYLYASFGLIGPMLVLFCVLSSFYRQYRNRYSFTEGLLAFVIFSMGITSNVIESPFAAFVFGVLLWCTFHIRRMQISTGKNT